MGSFNTASGKYCCNERRYISWTQQKLKVSIPQAVSTVATEISGFSYCGIGVSIPQAVSTVATNIVELEDGMSYLNVSIPQAVSTVATILKKMEWKIWTKSGFNTASGKYCCNGR